MLVVPCVALAATPVWLMTATVGVDEVHFTTEEMSWVVPSLNVPVAVNCCEEPSAMVGLAGVTAMLYTVAFVTVSVVVAGLWPLMVPVMVTLPGATPVATPSLLMTASA